MVVDGSQTYTGLHDIHRRFMVSSDCSTCHMAQSFPVFTRASAGGTGFAPIGCAGCHGRAEDEIPGTSSYGAGLLQKHDRNGVHLCRSCHDDADPANCTPVAEAVPPPYYFAPDPDHPHKPTDPCNAGGTGENIAGGPDGLDNDGNGLYDQLDCSLLFTDGFETGDSRPLVERRSLDRPPQPSISCSGGRAPSGATWVRKRKSSEPAAARASMPRGDATATTLVEDAERV